MPNAWEQRYLDGDTPWNIDQPLAEVRRVLDLDKIPVGRALELGCGTGSHAVLLASRGFDVTAVDISATAIARAEARARAASVQCRFFARDIWDLPDLGEPFPFVLDVGCYHAIRREDEAGYVGVLDRWVAADGWLLVLAGNANEATTPGPPTVTEAEIRNAFEHRFSIEHLETFRFDSSGRRQTRPLGWSVLMRKK